MCAECPRRIKFANCSMHFGIWDCLTMTKATSAPHYSTRIFWSEEDGGFIAMCPELRNVSAFGETEEVAVRELQEAVQLALETYRDEGWPFPEPATQDRFSGQFRLRLPKSLHATLSAHAEEDGVSLNTFIVHLLSEA